MNDILLAKLVAEVIFLAGNYVIARIQAHLFDNNERIDHGLWLTVYVCVAIIASLLCHGWLIFSCLILQRMVFFNPILNIIRKKPFFYTNTVDPQGSKIDRILGKSYTAVWIVCAVSLIVINILMFTHDAVGHN